MLHFAGSAAKPWQVALPSAGGSNGSWGRRRLNDSRAMGRAYQLWAHSAARVAGDFVPYIQAERSV